MEGWRSIRRLTPTWITAFFGLHAAAFTYPLILNPGSLVGTHGDALFSVWRLAWIGHQLRADPLNLFNGNIFYPAARTLAYSDAVLLPGLAWAPLHWLGTPPLLAYNWVLLTAFVLNGVGAFALVRHLSGSAAAGFIGGLVFAFAPFRFDHFDHLEMQLSFWMPLAFLAWHRGLETGSSRQFLLASVLAACQVLSCIYYGVFLLTSLGVLTVSVSWRQPKTAAWRLASTLAVPVLVLGIYSLPYLANRQELGERSLREVMSWSARPGDFLSAPNANVLYGWTDSLAVSERHLFPGITAAVLAVIGLWPMADRVRRIHAGHLAFGVLLAFGYNAFVYPFLFEWLLPYRGLRVPARATILVLLSLSVLGGLGLATIRSRLGTTARTAVAIAAIVMTSAEYFSRPSFREVDPQASPWYSMLAQMEDAVVFEWPVSHPSRLTEMVDVFYMYRSTQHWRPLLNGYSGKYSSAYYTLLEEMRGFPDGNSIRHLQGAGATILIVHEVPNSRVPYEYAFERLARDPAVRVLAEDHDSGRRIAFFRLLPR